MKVTICTPTYNRSHTLERLYNSLVLQTNFDFIWLIVDDGSFDNTEDIVNRFISENRIKIKYLKQENGGKHRAVNRGIQIASSEYFAIVDSDDYLLENAVDKIINAFSTINPIEFAGVSFNRGYTETRIIGSSFQGKYIDATSIERKKHHIHGDKFECFYTSVLKHNKFPTIEGENFMSEIVLWTRIASQGLKIRWFNEIIYICEYLENGLTDCNDKLLENNPKGYALRIREQVSLANISFKDKLGYYSSYFNVRKKHALVSEIAKEIDTNIFMIYLSVFARWLLNK